MDHDDPGGRRRIPRDFDEIRSAEITAGAPRGSDGAGCRRILPQEFSGAPQISKKNR